MSETRTYTGGCHCGAVRYDVTTALSDLMDCNCSRCSKLGVVLQFAPASDFHLRKGEDALTLYHFNTGKIDHLFCKHCGIESFARGKGEDGSEMVMINVNCLDEVEPVDRSKIYHWDGRSTPTVAA
jgi:hypothetical protein